MLLASETAPVFMDLVVLTVTLAVPCLGAVFYLSPDGDDSGSGGRGSPWRSIDRANAGARPGDDVVFLPGVYQGTIAPESSGTPDARTIREHIEEVRHLRRFRFYTHGNAKEGQHFWFDEFAILPAEG